MDAAVSYYKENDSRGEYVLVLAGKSKEDIEKENQAKWENLTLSEHMDIYLKQGLSKKDAMKAVAKDRNVPKRDIYNQLLEE